MRSDLLSIKPKRIGALTLFALALLFSTESMAMFDYYIFSEVRGVVVSNGKPVVGARLERSYSWSWKNRKGQDETVTNDKGEFYFPEITGFAWLGWLPHEPVIRQNIQIKYEGKSYEAWFYFKRDYDRNGELGGKPLDLYCSLQAPSESLETGVVGAVATGICRLR